MRRIQCSIDPPPPFFSTLLQYRKFELESFPIRIENYVRQYPFALRFPADCDENRRSALSLLSSGSCQFSLSDGPLHLGVKELCLGVGELCLCLF
jgi:hypothetical protein